MDSKRSWNDHKKNSKLTTGKWTTKELSKLRKEICRYSHRHNLSPEQLSSICEDTTPDEFSKIWTKLAKHFPTRSVQSVHNACKRNFNPLNYKGKWELWEEQELIRLVEKNGNRWKEIGEAIQRTALNCKDKWKQMGAQNKDKRKKGPWSAEEILELVNLVIKDSGLTPLNLKKFDVTNEDVLIRQLQEFIEPIKGKLAKKDINWERISEILVTRSSVDCRHKWGPFLYGKITGTDNFSEKEDRRLIRGIRKQNPTDRNDIDFSKINNGKIPSQNRFRWNVLYRAISGRLNLSIEEVLDKLEAAYEAEKLEETNESKAETIVDYYKAKYFD